MPIKSIIVWGDSILKGIVSSEDLKEIRPIENNALAIAGKNLNIEVINKSIYGAPITKIRQTQIKNLNKNLSADICLIESATNDSDYDWNLISSNPNEHHDPKVPLDDFKNILEQTVQTAIENSITPVLVTSTPLVTKWWFDYICIGQNREALLKFINNDPEVLFKNQEQYSNTVKEFATKNNIQLIDLRTEFLKSDDYTKLMCKDGVHPNVEGHKFMAEIFEKILPTIRPDQGTLCSRP